jgi:uncharacterized membrane protein YbhN (UPF0104 family)
LRTAVLLAVGLAALTGLILAVKPLRLFAVLRQVSPAELLTMLPVALGIYIFRGLGWWVALRRIGVRLSPLRATWALFAGKPLVFVPLGDLGRVAVLEAMGVEGHDAGELVGTVAFQELTYLTLMGLAMLPGISVVPQIGAVVAVLLPIQLIIFVILFYRPAFERAVTLAEHAGLLRRYDAELRHIRGSFIRLFNGPTLAATVFLNGISVLLAFVLFEQALHAVRVTGVGFLQAAMIYSLGFILSGFTFLPGNLGAYEGILTFFTSLQGVAPTSATAAALLYRGFNDLLVAGIGIGLWLPIRRMRKRRRERRAWR